MTCMMTYISYAEEIVIDLGTITIRDNTAVQDDLKTLVDRIHPTSKQKTPAEYKAYFTKICRSIIIFRVAELVNSIRIRDITKQASSDEEQAEKRSIIEEVE